jgi:xanthine dehydrogenase accessory factor
MRSPDAEVLQAALDWHRDGHAVTLVTVARTWGSSPRPAGSMMAVRGDGRIAGSVSGGCIEQDLAERFSTGGAPRAPERVGYGVTAESTRRFGLPCGGRLELVAEPLAKPTEIETILERLARRELVLRRLILDEARSSLSPAARDREFLYDGERLEKVFGPAWRLLLIGAGQLSRYLAEMAQALDYQVVVCDPRDDYAAAWEVEGAKLDTRMPDDAAMALADDPRSAVVALTHDPKLDDMALMVALESRAFYVGALGSKANNAKRRERLTALGVPAPALARLHGPVGLHLGSRTPPEIAIAILAELIAVRRGVAVTARPALEVTSHTDRLGLPA